MTQLNLRLKREQPLRESLKRACFKVINGLGIQAPNPNEERLRVRCGARRHFVELLKHTITESRLLADRLKLKAFEFAEVPMQPRASLSKDARKEKFASFKGNSSHSCSSLRPRLEPSPKSLLHSRDRAIPGEPSKLFSKAAPRSLEASESFRTSVVGRKEGPLPPRLHSLTPSG